jgi:SRSO17 transposase
MDVDSIKELGPRLTEFLERFSDCGSEKVRHHFQTYVAGQISLIDRKNVEQIALHSGEVPRTLQDFLASYDWDHELMRNRLQQVVAQDQGKSNSIGIIDETSFAKKGDKTPGVQRQWCGAVGKTDNCFVTVHLSYAHDDFRCLIDEDLFLPESWSNDRPRCRQAKIPEDVMYRPKSEIALEQHQRASDNGIVFEWLTFDEWYGSKPAFLDVLDKRKQKYVGEIPRNFRVWMKEPKVTHRNYRKANRGRSRKTPRVVAAAPKTKTVEQCFEQSAEFHDQPWEQWHVKDTQKGPKVVEVKHTIVFRKMENGMPSIPNHLVVVGDVSNPETLKYFLSNALPKTKVGPILKCAFSRWNVERCFQDDKSYIGLDEFEGRSYPGLLRHLILSAVSLLFLARMRQEFQQTYPELTISQLKQAMSSLIESWWMTPENAERLFKSMAYKLTYYQKRNAQARKSHTKTRNKKLAAMGIDMDSISKCSWDTS